MFLSVLFLEFCSFFHHFIRICHVWHYALDDLYITGKKDEKTRHYDMSFSIKQQISMWVLVSVLHVDTALGSYTHHFICV